MEQLIGSFNFQTTGKASFGAHANATAALVVVGDYSGSLGSGETGGGGSGSVAANRKSGTVRLRLAGGGSKVSVNGDWAS